MDLRRAITSPVTAAILYALAVYGPMDVRELLDHVEELTGRRLSPQSLYRYLYYYEAKGWLARGSPLWNLTGEGFSRVCKYARSLARLLGLSSSELFQLCMGSEGLPRVEDPRKSVEAARKHVEDGLRAGKRCSTLEKFERIKHMLGSEEREILETLVRHRCTWGVGYRYFDELVEELGYSTQELLRLLRRLQSKGLVYIYEDRAKRAVRVGLGRNLR